MLNLLRNRSQTATKTTTLRHSHGGLTYHRIARDHQNLASSASISNNLSNNSSLMRLFSSAAAAPKESQQSADPFSGSTTPTTNSLQEQMDHQREVIKRIRDRKETILKKSEYSRALAYDIGVWPAGKKNIDAKAVTMSEYADQPGAYNNFIIKMNELYRSEKAWQRKQNEAFNRMKMAPLYERNPINKILFEYAELSTKGFDCRIVARSLQLINQGFQARGWQGETFGDMTYLEVPYNYRFYKLNEDIKYGLQANKNSYMNPQNFATITRELGTLGFKDTELIELEFDKLDKMTRLALGEEIEEDLTVSLQQYRYGEGFKGMTPKWYIYQGFEESKLFEKHLATLLEWKEEKRSKSDRDSTEVEIVKKAMAEMIEASRDVKDMQAEQEAAIHNLRDQFFKLQQAENQYDFIRDNQYIKFELLELQEQMIAAGYMQPQEDFKQKYKGFLGMDAASEVFYDVVLNMRPEILSPHFDAYHDAIGIDNERSKDKDFIEKLTKDKHNEMNAQSFSQILVGLERQALSYRLDIKDKDYPSEFYARYVDETRDLTDNYAVKQEEIYQNKPTHIAMERAYLKGWTTFIDRTKEVPTILRQLIKHPETTKADLMCAFRGLSTARFDDYELRDKLADRLAKGKYKSYLNAQSAVDGLVGLVGGSRLPKQHQKVTSLAVSFLTHNITHMTFLQKCEAIYALSAISAAEKQKNVPKKRAKLIQMLIDEIDDLNWLEVGNELTQYEFEKLVCATHNFRYGEDSINKFSFKNTNLHRFLLSGDIARLNYIEHHSPQYDPLKPRVLGGLAHAITNNRQNENAYQMHQEMNLSDSDAFHPYRSDLLTGFEGRKIALFLLNSRTGMRDTVMPHGETQVQIKVIENAHKSGSKDDVLGDKTPKVYGVGLPMRNIIDYDLAKNKLQMKKNINLRDEVKKVMENRGVNCGGIGFKFDHLDAFSNKIGQKFAFLQDEGRVSGNLEKLMEQLYRVQVIRDQNESHFEPDMIDVGRNEVKFQILKLQLLYDNYIGKDEKKLVQVCLPDDIASFDELIDSTNAKKVVAQQSRTRPASTLQEKYPWIGTRLGVEVPKNYEGKQKKDIVVELLNRDFLWHEEYHHYDDWKSKMEQTYDQFNLLQIDANDKEEPKFYFEEKEWKRRIPRGVFPFPNFKRQIVQKPKIQADKKLEAISNSADKLSKFERSPLDFMIEKELERTGSMKEITPEMSLITSLQNVKQGIKGGLSDNEIAKLLFSDVQFTDQLIEDHLQRLEGSKPKGRSKGVEFVKRDAKALRKFKNRPGDYVPAYDHFFMREAVRKGNPEELFWKIYEQRPEVGTMKLENEAEFNRLRDELGNLLLNYKRANEDNMQLSSSLPNTLDVGIDLDSLQAVRDGMHQANVDLLDLDLREKHYLKKELARAETNLIKARISYKIHSELPLTAAEEKYKEAWIQALKDQKSLVCPLSDGTLCTGSPTKLTLANLQPQDKYAFASLGKVNLSEEEVQHFSISDLVYELNHFVDPATVRKIEFALMEDDIKREWNLKGDFTIVEQRNKEVDLALKEIEELAWRMASQFNPREKQGIKDVISIGRNLEAFDKEFYETDMKSFEEFFELANQFDDRNSLLERWIGRKDTDCELRVNLPTNEMKLSDFEIQKRTLKNERKAREMIVLNMLPQNSNIGEKWRKTDYKQLSSRDLHQITEALSVRLHALDKEYPAFLPHAVLAIMEHPNLAKNDRYHLESYCKMFELDWRMDSHYTNLDQLLLKKPIYLNSQDRSNTLQTPDLDTNWAAEKLGQSQTPYLKDLANKFMGNF